MLIVQYNIPSILPTNLAHISNSRILLEVRKCMYIEWSTITNSTSSKDPFPSDELCYNQHYGQQHYH